MAQRMLPWRCSLFQTKKVIGAIARWCQPILSANRPRHSFERLVALPATSASSLNLWHQHENERRGNDLVQTLITPQITPGRHAAKTAGEAGLGSHGPGFGVTNRARSSDPQSPQRRPDDVETVSQFPQ